MKEYKCDLGCGSAKKPGFIGVDIVKLPGVDMVADLNKPLPIKSNSVIEINCCNVLEHIDNLDVTMNEVYRICCPNTVVHISVPHFSSCLAFYEYHKRFFNIFSFMDYTNNPRMKHSNNGKFEIVNKKIIFMKYGFYKFNYIFEWFFNLCELFRVIYDETCLHSLFPAGEIHLTLKAKKSVI